VSPRASKVLVAVCGIAGGWFGYWLGQSSVSVRYWIVEPTTSTVGPNFAWWTKNVDWHAGGLQRRLAYLADDQLFPFWRFLLAIGLAVLFAYLAAVVVTRLPGWRARRVLQNGAPGQATVLRVQETGEYALGPEGMENQLAVELYVRGEGGSPYRARTIQFFTESLQQALQPGARVFVRYSPAKPERVAIVEPLAE
jgi:hypothetical protein